MQHCVGANVSGPRHRTRCGVWISSPTSLPRATLPSIDRAGSVHARKSRHRSWAEVARGRRGGCAESDPAEAWSSKVYLLRQRIGVYQSDHGSLGVSQPGADRLLATGEADRQRICGIVQRHAAGGVFGRALVRDADRGQASHRGLEAGIQ